MSLNYMCVSSGSLQFDIGLILSPHEDFDIFFLLTKKTLVIGVSTLELAISMGTISIRLRVGMITVTPHMLSIIGQWNRNALYISINRIHTYSYQYQIR